ncbi:hypothetical protein INT44_009093 [Umbelopsis vinacea]|uniref:Methyltransferase domain-containing protein n=1 Tax=Umbelopsis vinacea TaxID=44442 RepID=A0A8H7Q2F0_9FUNG|nr:hypothetical protein INT44_009093 [Umbelopsis vinacea]
MQSTTTTKKSEVLSSDGNDIHYILPSNDSETERLRLNHSMWKYALGGLQTAPLHEDLERGIKVLDIGCGPGWWSVDMAKKYPKSQFIGIDITANFPLVEAHDNISFQVINAGTGLPFSDGEFDYVFQRFLVMGFSVDQYRLVIKEINRVLKSGGTIEILEMVSKYNDAGPWFQKIGNWIEKALQLSGLDPTIATKLAGMLQDAGFSHVTDRLRRIPIGSWGGSLGDMYLAIQKLALPAVMTMVIHLGVTTKEAFRAVMSKAIEESSEHNTSGDFHIVCAIKPIY